MLVWLKVKFCIGDVKIRLRLAMMNQVKIHLVVSNQCPSYL